MIFRNDNHGVLFEKEIRYHKGCSRKFAAALFLLTADTRLWHQAENHIGANEIDIAAMKPRRLDAMAYVCYALAMTPEKHRLICRGRCWKMERGKTYDIDELVEISSFDVDFGRL